MQEMQCVHFSWCKPPPHISCVELEVQLVYVFAWAEVAFQYGTLLNLLKNMNLCSSTNCIKQIMNVPFMQWNKYFHTVKDEVFHSTWLRLVEWNVSSFLSHFEVINYKIINHHSHIYFMKAYRIIILGSVLATYLKQISAHPKWFF